MPTPFYRKNEADLATGADNLIAIVTPAAATYGLSAAEVTSYTATAATYSTALATAITPSTRTSVAIDAKNLAKRNLKTASVNIARTITAFSTVTDSQLLALGLNARPVPAPRPVPETAPVIEIVSVSGRLVKARVHDGSTESRRKPFGAIGANVYSYVGAVAPTEPTEYHFEGMATRSTIDILFSNTVPSGALVWLSAQWISARGQLSVGSVPISVTIQGGLIPVAA